MLEWLQLSELQFSCPCVSPSQLCWCHDLVTSPGDPPSALSRQRFLRMLNLTDDSEAWGPSEGTSTLSRFRIQTHTADRQGQRGERVGSWTWGNDNGVLRARTVWWPWLFLTSTQPISLRLQCLCVLVERLQLYSAVSLFPRWSKPLQPSGAHIPLLKKKSLQAASSYILWQIQWFPQDLWILDLHSHRYCSP